MEKLVNSGATVVGVDLLDEGEFLSDGKPVARRPGVKNPREAAAYTLGYNHALFVHRVHDVTSVVNFVKNGHERQTRQITLIGLDGAGPWAAAARAQCGQAIDQAVIDTGGFRFGKVLDLADPNFLPGGAKYGDLPALLALAAPGKTWVAGETKEALSLALAQYGALKAGQNLTRYTGEPHKTRTVALEWLLSESGK